MPLQGIPTLAHLEQGFVLLKGIVGLAETAQANGYPNLAESLVEAFKVGVDELKVIPRPPATGAKMEFGKPEPK